jgi:hypothetical protein
MLLWSLDPVQFPCLLPAKQVTTPIVFEGIVNRRFETTRNIVVNGIGAGGLALSVV